MRNDETQTEASSPMGIETEYDEDGKPVQARIVPVPDRDFDRAIGAAPLPMGQSGGVLIDDGGEDATSTASQLSFFTSTESPAEHIARPYLEMVDEAFMAGDPLRARLAVIELARRVAALEPRTVEPRTLTDLLKAFTSLCDRIEQRK